MNNENRKRNITIIIFVVILLALIAVSWQVLGTQTFVRTSLSGLTLGSLFFMVAAGLTLIFGLMDVLNFAHGATFMLGAYMGWQFYTNPTFIFGLIPLISAFVAGLQLLPILKPRLIRLNLSESLQQNLPRIGYFLVIVLVILAVLNFDIMGLAETAMVAFTTTSAGNPLAEISAQEPLARFWIRPVLLFAAGALAAFAISKPGDKKEFAVAEKETQKWLIVGGLAVATVLLSLFREQLSEIVLLMNGNLRFLLSIIVAAVFGLVFGMLIEILLIRPLYVRSTFIVLMTMGLSFVIREIVQVLWTPLAYQMVRPPQFAAAGKAETLAEWLENGNSTLNILGVTFPTYRLFIILLGLVMFIFITILMTKTRLGMIIRAGVQDPEMVEALGINVRQVFTFVFALGIAMAALGGIGAAPFIPIQPLMGDTYQMQGFITVVLGGMGSYVGAFIGAMTLGLARAFGDYFALKLSLSPAIAEASTVIIMIIVLLVRPTGLFGKKE
ncbi:MAG: branched-chain amino acid ABC transporter permease [Anaerolineae bacterium]|jgi:branched-chain amino acid transport system permease protein|nr:branched-chain amino acid ABC transporter permease [Anaerolineae bacterium]